MISRLKTLFYRVQIKLLIVFKPTLLFYKINRLDWYKDTLRHWIDSNKFISKINVLEVGCATGCLTTHLSQSGYIVTGVDASSKMIDLAKEHHSNVPFFVADVLELPFENESFDAVIAASLINIVSDKQGAIQKMVHICKKGGKVSVLLPSSSFNDTHLVSLIDFLDIYGFSAAALEAWHSSAPKMGINDIKKLLIDAGLTIVSTEIYLQGMVISVSGEKCY